MRLVMILECPNYTWRYIDSKVCDLGNLSNLFGAILRVVTVESAREDYGVKVP